MRRPRLTRPLRSWPERLERLGAFVVRLDLAAGRLVRRERRPPVDVLMQVLADRARYEQLPADAIDEEAWRATADHLTRALRHNGYRL